MDKNLSKQSRVSSKSAEEWQTFMNRDVPEPPAIDREQRKFASVREAAEKLGLPIDPRLAHVFSQPRFEQRTPPWYKARHEAITASDFGAAAGKAEYGNPVQVYRKKIDSRPQEFSQFARKAMDHGTKYEDAAAYVYEQQTGNRIIDFGLLSHWKLWEMKPPGMDQMRWFDLIHRPTRPAEHISEADWKTVCDLRWLKGSPDGITHNGILIEIKCPFSKMTPGVIKDMYMAQVQLNMELAGVDTCHFIQFVPQRSWFFGERFDMFEVRRDPEWFREHKDKAKTVWNWITHTRKHGTIPSDLAGKVQFTVESTRERPMVESARSRSRSSSVRREKPAPVYAFRDFNPVESVWTDPETAAAAADTKRQRRTEPPPRVFADPSNGTDPEPQECDSEEERMVFSFAEGTCTTPVLPSPATAAIVPPQQQQAKYLETTTKTSTNSLLPKIDVTHLLQPGPLKSESQQAEKKSTTVASAQSDDPPQQLQPDDADEAKKRQ